MTDNDPAQHLARFASQSARRQRTDIKHKILHKLIADHGYTDRATLGMAWGISDRVARDSIRRLIRDGALREHTLPASRRRLLLLTRDGAAEVAALLGRDVRALRSDQIGRTLIDHTLAVQQALITICRDTRESDLAMERIGFERQIRSSIPSWDPLRIDGVIRGDGRHPTDLIEVELTAKTGRSLSRRIQQLTADLNAKSPTARVWWAGPEPILRKINDIFEQLIDSGELSGDAVPGDRNQWLPRPPD